MSFLNYLNCKDSTLRLALSKMQKALEIVWYFCNQHTFGLLCSYSYQSAQTRPTSPNFDSHNNLSICTFHGFHHELHNVVVSAKIWHEMPVNCTRHVHVRLCGNAGGHLQPNSIRFLFFPNLNKRFPKKRPVLINKIIPSKRRSTREFEESR